MSEHVSEGKEERKGKGKREMYIEYKGHNWDYRTKTNKRTPPRRVPSTQHGGHRPCHQIFHRPLATGHHAGRHTGGHTHHAPRSFFPPFFLSLLLSLFSFLFLSSSSNPPPLLSDSDAQLLDRQAVRGGALPVVERVADVVQLALLSSPPRPFRFSFPSSHGHPVSAFACGCIFFVNGHAEVANAPPPLRSRKCTPGRTRARCRRWGTAR